MKASNNTPSTERFVIYVRVSTEKQQLSPVAQRERCVEYVNDIHGEVVEVVEDLDVSGGDNRRPGLLRALAVARRHGATLLAAKLDRLTRDLEFGGWLFNKEKSGVSVMSLDVPRQISDNSLLLAVYLGMSDHERKLISRRTKSGLAVIKEIIEKNGFHISKKGNRITRLGSPVAAESMTDELRARSIEKRRQNAANDENNVRAVNELKQLKSSGRFTTLTAAAQHLTDCGIFTRRGSFHSATSVSRLIARYID